MMPSKTILTLLLAMLIVNSQCYNLKRPGLEKSSIGISPEIQTDTKSGATLDEPSFFRSPGTDLEQAKFSAVLDDFFAVLAGSSTPPSDPLTDNNNTFIIVTPEIQTDSYRGTTLKAAGAVSEQGNFSAVLDDIVGSTTPISDPLTDNNNPFITITPETQTDLYRGTTLKAAGADSEKGIFSAVIDDIVGSTTPLPDPLTDNNNSFIIITPETQTDSYRGTTLKAVGADSENGNFSAVLDDIVGSSTPLPYPLTDNNNSFIITPETQTDSYRGTTLKAAGADSEQGNFSVFFPTTDSNKGKISSDIDVILGYSTPLPGPSNNTIIEASKTNSIEIPVAPRNLTVGKKVPIVTTHSKHTIKKLPPYIYEPEIVCCK